jgi:hypothetical protein
MWLRLAGALLVTLAAIGALEYFGVSRVLGGRSPDEVGEAQGRTGEFFWLMIFFVVMATSLLAAARRWAGHLRRAVVRPQGRHRS